MNIVAILPQALLVALALVMLGLGLSMRVDDFRRIRRHPAAVTLALVLQVIVLPLVCYAIARGFGLAPAYAVGLLILAASPGGITASLFSHLFGGNVAMNVTLTAINTILAIVTLPLIANLAIGHFQPEGASGQVVPLQFGKVVQVVAVVLVPVAIGMAVAARAPRLAARAQRPFKIFSALVLAAFAIGALVQERAALIDSFASLGPAVVLFNVVSLLVGYAFSRAAGMDRGTAKAIAFEIGIHNSTLALYVALSILASYQIALPAALYSVSMFVTATLFGMVLGRGRAARVTP